MMKVSLPTWLQSVHHDGSPVYVSDPYPQLGDTVHIRLRTGIDAPVRRVFLRTFPNGEQALTLMELEEETDLVCWWSVDLSIVEPVVHYRFLLEADDGVWWFTAAGPSLREVLDSTDFRILADYDPPAWVHESVFYQIFPDRFANGDPANDPRPGEEVFPGVTFQLLPWSTLPPGGPFSSTLFYGGDLQGIVDRLAYLQELGVDALYLNPVFTAPSNHRYDVVDYENVDPHLGGNEALVALRRALDVRGIRYILDIVPNHCGVHHPWFQTACADPTAPEAEFFTFTRHPDEYATWLGVRRLPKLNYASAELRRRIYAGAEAVFRRWLRPPFSADGWRIDVANMLARQGPFQQGTQVARGIRETVKETRPDAYLIGENFFDATPQLQGDQWDGVMNYLGFTTPLWHWLRGLQQRAFRMPEPIASRVPWPTHALAASWRAVRAAIPWVIALQQFNMVGSHDTPRIRTTVGGSPALHRLAAVLQFTYPGVPGLYYGDEIGLEDQPGVGSRACMVWDEAHWEHELLDFYRRLVALRRDSAVLQHGGFQVLALEQDTLVYQREAETGRVVVIGQRGAQARPPGGLDVTHGNIPDGTHFVEHFSGQEAVVQEGQLPLPEHPQGATIWKTSE